MGVTHLRAYQKISNARIVAVCGVHRLPQNGVLRGVAGNLKSPDNIHLSPQVKVYDQFEKLLANPDVELVDICTPTPFHALQVIAALKSGKHVLCEKPLARTPADAQKILKAANASRTFLMPAMCMRFWPGWREVKGIIARKAFGRGLAAGFRRVSSLPQWSASNTYAGGDSGGALYDLHIHDTDFVNHLFGRPQKVYSSGVIGANGLINHVATQYHYPGGPSVQAEGSWLNQRGFNMAFIINCERATLEFDYLHGHNILLITETGKKPRPMKFKNADGYGAEIKYFVDCVARGRAPAMVTAEEALAALQICEAEEKSVRRGTAVRV